MRFQTHPCMNPCCEVTVAYRAKPPQHRPLPPPSSHDISSASVLGLGQPINALCLRSKVTHTHTHTHAQSQPQSQSNFSLLSLFTWSLHTAAHLSLKGFRVQSGCATSHIVKWAVKSIQLSPLSPQESCPLTSSLSMEARKFISTLCFLGNLAHRDLKPETDST